MGSTLPFPSAVPRRRLLVLEDHPVMRASLVDSINHTADLTVCGATADPAEAQHWLATGTPDLVITDLSLSGDSGFTFVEGATRSRPACPVLVFTMHSEGIHAPRAFHCGAAGYVTKDEGHGRLLAAIRQLLAGGLVFSDRVCQEILRRRQAAGAEHAPIPIALEDTEQRVLVLAGHRMAPAAIATALRTTAGEVEAIFEVLRTKLHLSTNAAVAHFGQLYVQAGPGPT